jgi:Skp family chaperone for outer membrane proteins
MTKLKHALLAAALAVPGLSAALPAAAQVGGIAVADPEAAVANSRAWTAAKTQIETTYKTQLDQAQSRRDAIARELQPLVTAYQTAARGANPNQTALQQQATTIQQKEQAGQAELSRLTQPAQRAQAYAIEQISAKLPDAVQAAVRAKNVSLLIRPQAALFLQPAADLTPAITAELDRVVPSVNINPPANWQPGQQGQQAAAPAAGTQPARPQQRPAQGR